MTLFLHQTLNTLRKCAALCHLKNGGVNIVTQCTGGQYKFVGFSDEVMDNDIFQLLWNIVLPVCAVSAILLCLLITPTARLKLKAWTAIPTPAPYFQPLFSDYKGNFQDWLVSHGNHGDVLKTEELLKIDSLTEAKPLKEAERYSSEFECHSTQCQSLCIGPGEEDRCMGGPVDAPAPATVGQSDMPVSLPLLKASFAKIFGSQSLDPADTIEGDSGCEDPTPSLDSCWPQGTLNIEPEGVCFSEDYCTLSDSHNGLIPTVVFRPAACSKENDVPPSDNSHNSLGSSLDVDGVES
ncbi:hypothetical protein JZ751_015139 [Albula glossodonta]|uniref:Uncharacterized protein n=1 Tax=Albula glossodonta TaxID=121402 RepID=A0A8T2NPX0_9TELE|nr:hypothetical protein JZ751_015139 [Albula glossodonta]